MKRFLLFAAFAGLGFSACHKTDMIQEKECIEFEVYSGIAPITRATPMNDDLIKTTSIGLYAYEHSEDFNENTTYNRPINGTYRLFFTGGWVSSGNLYWHETLKTSIFAYAPYVDITHPDPEQPLSVRDITEGYPIIGLTSPEDITKQVDFVVSNKTKTQNMTKPDVNKPVTLEFTHTLAKIGFQVMTINTANEVIVSSIVFGGDTADEKFYSSAAYYFDSGWSEHSEPNQKYTIRPGHGIIVESIPPFLADYTQLNEPDQYLMVIPRVFTKDIPIKISYTENMEEHVVSGTIPAMTFEANHQYTIRFKLDCIGNKILFNVVVSPWDDGGNIDVA